jgi:prepilin-type N-terminal cleavage/methylation domain-containing protein
MNKKSGFTLVEMLVVIGIIALIAVAVMSSFSYVQRMAWKSQSQTLVSNASTALTLYLQKERGWGELEDKMEFDADVCRILKAAKVLDSTVKASGDKDESESIDRYGLLDIWGQRKLRGNPDLGESIARQYRLQFRLDKNYDGSVDSSEDSPNGFEIRASALVWSRGPDGKDDTSSSGRYPKDDVLSFQIKGSK